MNLLYLIFIIFITNCYGNHILQPTGKMNFGKLNLSNITLKEYDDPEKYFIQAFQPMGAFDNLLYEFHKDFEDYQPSGSIYNYSLNEPQIIFYKKIYEKHTNFALEAMDNNKKLDFGQTFTFSPLNDYCNTGFEKDNAKLCLGHHPDNWDCIYENCISLSRTVPHYISIVLPPIYYNNKTTKQCFVPF